MNYFDHAASMPIYPEALEVLTKAHLNDFANPSSRHILGHELREKIETYRLDFLQAINASKKDLFIFTGSATESNNTIIRGLNFCERDNLLYSKADHPSVTAPVEEIAHERKIELREILLLKDGRIDQEYFSSLINEKTKLVVLSHVNNQSGVLEDIESLAKIVKEKSNAHVHIDSVQSFGKINFQNISNIDSLSLSSHKIGGPKGVAGLFLKHTHKMRPLLFGGGQEIGLRSSTEAYPLIAGFHKAMKISLAETEQAFIDSCEYYKIIRGTLSDKISGISFPFNATSPYIISFIIPKISSDIILRHLEMREVFISSTSACSSKVSGFNPSLFALNVPEHLHKNFLRISLSPRTKKDEVDALLREFVKVWESLKHIL